MFIHDLSKQQKHKNTINIWFLFDNPFLPIDNAFPAFQETFSIALTGGAKRSRVELESSSWLREINCGLMGLWEEMSDL